MGRGKIKKAKSVVGSKIVATNDSSKLLDIKHPIFCFKYLQKKHHLDECENSEKVSLINRLCKLSQMTWIQIQMADKHGFGSEKIAQTSIKAGIPSHISKDETLYALRFDGVKAMVGYRNSFIFHVLYLDRDFTLYNH